jgi:hypothetical protein
VADPVGVEVEGRDADGTGVTPARTGVDDADGDGLGAVDADADAVGVGVAALDAWVVAVGEGDTTAAAHSGRVMVFESSVTAPVRANKRPCTVTPVFAVTDVWASTEPISVDPVPRVAELPTCQKTWHGFAPPSKSTELADAVISVLPA